jgi:FkbM family methyltransferase
VYSRDVPGELDEASRFGYGDAGTTSDRGTTTLLTIRSLAERMSREVVLRRRLPAAFGGATVFVSPGKGGLRYWLPGFSRSDPHLLRFAKERVRSGARVWDIGANVGTFTFSAACRAGPTGHVLAVEADAESASLLFRTRRTLPRATYASVDILTAAVTAPGARVGHLSMAVRAGASNALVGFGTSQAGGERERRTVALLTLDELLAAFGTPDVVKIDVEGAEREVLRGAEKLLEKRPIFHVEVARANAPWIGDLFRLNGYRLYDADAGDSETSMPTANCLAIPESPRA